MDSGLMSKDEVIRFSIIGARNNLGDAAELIDMALISLAELERALELEKIVEEPEEAEG